jgi:hypothetical protein
VAPDSQLDYRFGWRWLLPIVRGEQILLLGFSAEDAAFWKRILLTASVTDDASKGTLWLVNGQWPDCVAGLDTAHLRHLCVLGSGKVVAAWRGWMGGRFSEICDYALLPSGNPRVLVPLGKIDWVIQGLALHRPGRRVARAAVALLKVLARVGIVRPLRARMLCIASQDVGIPPQGLGQAGLASSDIGAPRRFALYLGTQDDNRKTVILPLGGRRQAILKQGQSPQAQTAIRNEADALRAMGQTSLSAQVPALFDLVDRDGQVTLHQEYRPRQPMPAQAMRRAGVDFLVELSRQGRSIRPLGDVLHQSGLMTADEARAAGQEAYAWLRERLDSMAVAGESVWGHRSHGDFAPWNFAWTAKGFFVFDWEESQPWDVALGDAFYAVLAPAVHVVRSTEIAVVESDALALAAELVERAGLRIGNVRLYWGVWLLRRMSRKPDPIFEQLLERLVAAWQ